MAREARSIRGTLVTIGDEVLFGDILNTNARYIAMELRAKGFLLNRMITVGDQHDTIAATLLDAIKDTHFLVVTGGLGPTDDDRTNAAVAEAFGRRLELHTEYTAWLEARLKSMGRSWNAHLEKMATLPAGARKIGWEMAGFFLEHESVPCYFLPGVPHEMKDLMRAHVLPDLQARYPNRLFYVKRTLRVVGFYESELNGLIERVATEPGFKEIGYLPHGGEIRLTLLGAGASEEEALCRVEDLEASVVPLLGSHHIVGRDEETLEGAVGEALRRLGWKLSVAESCTGGLLARKITSVPGASDYFERGLVVYSNRAKTEMLAVPEGLIREHGAVSGPVAEAMARGLHRLAGTEAVLAVTGIAGPSGGTEEKPVGTVFVACLAGDFSGVKRFHFKGDREQIQERSAQAALIWLWRILTGDPDVRCH